MISSVERKFYAMNQLMLQTYLCMYTCTYVSTYVCIQACPYALYQLNQRFIRIRLVFMKESEISTGIAKTKKQKLRKNKNAKHKTSTN